MLHKHAIGVLSLLLLTLGFPFITNSNGIDLNNGSLRFTISNDRIIFNANIIGGETSSSFLVTGSISGGKFLSANLQFHVISNALRFFLSMSRVKFRYIDISIRRYSRFNMYKLNGSMEMVGDDHVLKFLMNFNVAVLGNTSIEKVKIKGAIIPVSGDQRLNMLALSLIDDILKIFFDRVENMSSELVKVENINVERVPTIKGIGARVEVVLNINNPRIAWKNIIGRVFEPYFLDYLRLIFDNRVKDYLLDLKLIANNSESIHGRVSIVFNESFSRLLGLNYTRLDSKAVLTYYGGPNGTILNVFNMVLEPRGSLKESLREIGLFFYRLIGEHNIIIIVKSKNTNLETEGIPIKPVSANRTTIIWNRSIALLYLYRIIVVENNVNINYPLILILIMLAALGLFYIARRVRWK